MIENTIFKFSFSTGDGVFEEVDVLASELAEVVGKKTGRRLVGVQLLGPEYVDAKGAK